MSTASHPAELEICDDAFGRALPRPNLLLRLLARIVHIPLASEMFDSDIFAPLLRDGDARAAVVVEANPPTVAAYSDEFDAVVLLRIPDCQLDGPLAVGQRMIAVWNYLPAVTAPRDISMGPDAIGRFRNAEPLIGDLLSDDVDRLEQLRDGIDFAEWERAEQLGRQRMDARPGLFRWHVPGRTMMIAGDTWKMVVVGIVFIILLVVGLWMFA